MACQNGHLDIVVKLLDNVNTEMHKKLRQTKAMHTAENNIHYLPPDL
jgi:hydroxymethylglutaryl-CoA reductase